MNILYIDFETYHSRADKYDLKHISITKYINDSRFKVFGAGVQFNNDEPFWITGNNLQQFFRAHDWKDYIIVAHNGKFDGSILAWKYQVNPKQWRDTKSMAMAIYGASIPSFSLKYLSDRLGFVPKGVLKTDGIADLSEADEASLAEYCLTDVKICAKLYQELAPQIPESQWPIMDWTIRAFTEPKLVINQEIVKECQEGIEARKEAVLLDCGIDKEILSSNPQFAKYLLSLGYQVPMKKNKKGKMIPALASKDAEFIKMTQSNDPRLKQICLARKEVKKTMEIKRAEKLQTIGEKYPFDIIFSGATQTHRFSGGAGAGGNPQNFPKESELRKCIEAPEGSTLYVGDFKNIELRILAFLSREPKLIEAIRKGINVYSEFGQILYKRPVVKDTLEYKLSKAAVLGLGYQMGGKRFKEQCEGEEVNIDLSLAYDTVDLYRETYTHIPNFWRLCEVVIRMMLTGQEGYFPGFQQIKVKKNALVLPSGLEMKYPNLRPSLNKWGKQSWVYDKYDSQLTEIDTADIYGGKLTENICQALAGEMCKTAIQRLIDEGLPPQGQVHDEILLVANDELARVDLEHAMTDRLSWWPELVLDAEIGEGRNWYDAKKPKQEIVHG